MIVVAITASSVNIMGKLLRSGLADRTNEEGHVLTLLNRHSILHPSAFTKDMGSRIFYRMSERLCMSNRYLRTSSSWPPTILPSVDGVAGPTKQ
jgi:hypothetical protein